MGGQSPLQEATGRSKTASLPSLIKEGWREAPGRLPVAVLYASGTLIALVNECLDPKFSTIAVP